MDCGSPSGIDFELGIVLERFLTAPPSDRGRIEASVKACYAAWSKRYYDDYYASGEAYPPVHTDLTRNLLASAGVTSVLDAGCGPASMLRALMGLDAALYGFDLTPEMVVEARRVLSEKGGSGERIWQGSVLDGEAFVSAPDGRKIYDAGICFGVLPHVPEGSEAAIIANFKQVIRPGGLIALEARNELFSLFTLNRYSSEFFKGRLVDVDGLRARAGDETAALDQALKKLDEHFRMDLPPLRRGYEGEPGYDEVLSRTHNPFVLQEVAKAQGLTDVQVLFYHYHALPPMLQECAPNLFRRESISMEDPYDWRGHFLASAFFVVGQVPV